MLPAFEHAINCTYNSSIGCTPFEAGHGLAARSIAEARRAPKAARGTDPDMLEDVSSSFDESSLKLQIELAARLIDDARSTSEWHRRMTSKRLNQSGREIDLSKMKTFCKFLSMELRSSCKLQQGAYATTARHM